MSVEDCVENAITHTLRTVGNLHSVANREEPVPINRSNLGDILMCLRKMAFAVASATAMTMAGSAFAQDAQTNVSLTGSIRIGLSYSDPGGDADATVAMRNWASRLNLLGETAIGEGMTAFGRYEFGVDTSARNNGDGALSTRHAYVGLKGSFGQVLAGQTYHTFYDHVIGPVDLPWWGSCNGCLGVGGRTAQGLKYSGSAGPISGGATLYFIDEGEDILDGYELAGTYDAGVVKLGFGLQDFEEEVNDPDMVLGITVSGEAGSVEYAAAFTSQGAPANGGEDANAFDVYLAYGSAYIDIGTIDQGNSPFGVTLGFSTDIGPKTLAWFELQAVDPDIDGEDTAFDVRAALKYDWE